VRFSVENTQIQGQHRQNEEDEKDPPNGHIAFHMQSLLKINPVGNKKDLYPRSNTSWIKVLPAMVIVTCPGQTAVLTSMGSAMSPADSYSPLLDMICKQAAGYCQGIFNEKSLGDTTGE
jgi:hypothetical protein